MGGDEGGARLASEQFWAETYLPAYNLPARPSAKRVDERGLMTAFDELAPAKLGERVLEVGCAPGRWMVFYAERFGATVEGLEYTSYGADLTRRNLAACAVEGIVHEDDFWSFEPDEPYDLVLSLGFIEHFEDIDATFARHVPLIRPGGRLALSVPNFQGLNRVVQRWADPDWLALHNLEAMGVAGYRRRCEATGLQLETSAYVCGFDPSLISVRRRGRRLIAPFWHLRNRGYGDHLDAWWLSSFLLMVFRRPVDHAAPRAQI